MSFSTIKPRGESILEGFEWNGNGLQPFGKAVDAGREITGSGPFPVIALIPFGLVSRMVDAVR